MAFLFFFLDDELPEWALQKTMSSEEGFEWVEEKEG